MDSFSTLFKNAILKDAYSYYVANLSKSTLIPPIIEIVDGISKDYTNKFGDPLPSYDEIIHKSADTFVDSEHIGPYKKLLSSQSLIKNFENGKTICEYICKIHSSNLGWHYRRYVSYLSKDEETGDIMTLTVAYNATKEIRNAERKRERELKALEKERRLHEELERERETLRQNLDIIKVLASEYTYVFYVDIATGCLIPHIVSENSEIVYNVLEKYDGPKLYNSYIESMVYEPDKEMMRQYGCLEDLVKRLRHRKSISVTYRSTRLGVPHYSEMKIAKVNDIDEEPTALTIGFSDKDEEVISQFINDRLEEEYIAIYVVDLDKDTYRIYKEPSTTTVMNNPNISWSEALALFSKEVVPFSRELVENTGKPNFLKHELADFDRREYQFKVPGSVQPWHRCVIQVVDRNEDGSASTVIVTYTGIDDARSASIELEEKLKDALDMAQSANRAKTTFLNNMSHDIRTPMNAIIGYTGLAYSNIDDKDRVIDYLSKISQSSEHLLALINDVLDMSRIESGKMQLKTRPESLNEIIRELTNIVQADVNSKGLHFSVVSSDIDDAPVICDKLRLNQILLNLISNAIKYTPDGGHIIMSVDKLSVSRSGYVKYKFRITDDGPGMSPQFLKTIFVPFTRADSFALSGIQGSGLGMSITKNLVEMMNGHIEILSEEGVGTEVILNFRFKMAGSPAILKKPDDILTAGLHDSASEGKPVLLVEDNEMNREIAEYILKELGYSVDVAENGKEAFDKVRNSLPGRYSLILMDIRMPVLNGYEATRMIRSLDNPRLAGIPIIAMTANAFDEDRKAALSAGMNDHISKPFKVSVIRDTLAKYLE